MSHDPWSSVRVGAPEDVGPLLSDPAKQVQSAELVDAHALAWSLGVAASVIGELLAQGAPHVMVGRHARFRVRDVAAWLEARQSGAGGTAAARPSPPLVTSASKRPPAGKPTTPKPSSKKPGTKENRPMATKTKTKAKDKSINEALDSIDRELNDDETTGERRRQLRATLRKVRDSKAATDAEKRRARQILKKHDLEDDDKENADDGASALTRAHTTVANGVQHFRTPTSRTAALKRELAQKSRAAVASEQAKRGVEMTARSVETCKAAVESATAGLDAALTMVAAHAQVADRLEGAARVLPGERNKIAAVRAREQHHAAAATVDARRVDLERAESNLAAAKRSHKEAQNRLATAREEYENR